MPFLALRSYLPADHPDKAAEMGSEPTPGAFIDALLDVVEECRRVLAPHGSIAFELGDTYSGSGGGGGDYLEGGLRENQPGFGGSADKQREGNAAHWRAKNAEPAAWPLAKSLCLIPELFRIALVYGFNPLTGRTTPTWRARNVIRWVRPNPPVGALADKCRPATSEMVTACVGTKRYWDMDAVRTEAIDQRYRSTNGAKNATADPAEVQTANYDSRVPSNPAGAPLLDWWAIPTEGFPGAHYATWPSELCRRAILLMCPQRVCRVCGVPSERVTSIDYEPHGEPVRQNAEDRASKGDHKTINGSAGMMEHGRATRQATTLGWSDCSHNDWRRGVTLDPFCGSGTTLAVATGLGREAIGIDLDSRNLDLARERVGMFLEEAPA